MAPAEDQEIVLPWASVMVIMVLLNEAFTCATPETMFLRSRRRTRVASLAIPKILQARPSFQALGSFNFDLAGFDPTIAFKFWRHTRHEIPGSSPGMILGGGPP